MSNFLCGKLTFSRQLTTREAGELGFALAGFALEERLGLQLGCAIVQPGIFQLVGCSRAFDGVNLPFLVTDSPIWDASEAIIDKYAPEYPDAEPEGPLEARLRRVGRFVVRAAGLPEVTRLVVIVTSGLDEPREEETLRAEQLVERLLPRYDDVLEVPNVRFVIERAEV